MVSRAPRLARLLAIATLASPLAFPGIDEDLAQAAKSPYNLQRFVQTHVTFNWEPLWKALGVEERAFAQPCGTLGGRREDCSVELIRVSNDQMIVLLRLPVGTPVFLRYLGQGASDTPDNWLFGGYYRPIGKGPEAEYHILRVGAKPFLAIKRNDLIGFGVWIETEDWMDLTLPKFEPVLKLTTGAQFSAILDYVENDAHASVASLETEPVEAVRVGYQVSLTHNNVFLATRSDTATHTRQGNGFAFDASRSTRPKAEIDALYDLESAPPEDYLRYLLPEFKKIAAGPNGEMKNWLKRLLSASGDTPQKREIQAVLTP